MGWESSDVVRLDLALFLCTETFGLAVTCFTSDKNLTLSGVYFKASSQGKNKSRQLPQLRGRYQILVNQQYSFNIPDIC